MYKNMCICVWACICMCVYAYTMRKLCLSLKKDKVICVFYAKRETSLDRNETNNIPRDIIEHNLIVIEFNIGNFYFLVYIVSYSTS